MDPSTHPADTSPHRTQTIAVLALALMLRLLAIGSTLANRPPQWIFAHGLEMGLLAKSLLDGQGLSSPFGTPTGPTAFIAPGYPILVAGIFRVFGVYSAGSAIAILLLHLTASMVTVWLVLHVARKLFDATTALIAGLIWACSIPLLLAPTIFWDTSLSICLLMGLIALALRYQDGLSKSAWILLGVYCGFTALLNPALLFTLIAILGWLAWNTRSSSRWTPLLAVLAFTIVFSPWPIRNARVFHAFIPLRTTVGFELWMGNHEGSTGFLQESLFPTYNPGELAAYKTQGELAYTQNKTRLAQLYIEQHPATFLALTARRIFRFWTGTGTEGGSIFFPMHAATTSLLGLIGLWLALRKRLKTGFLLAIPLLLFPTPYYLTHAEFRYRLAIDPIVTVLAGYTLVTLVRRLSVPPAAPTTAERHPEQAVLG